MFVPFESLPPDARIWIFQTDRPLTAEEKNLAEDRLLEFTNEWAVHGNPFNTSYTIQHHHFIILAADESSQNASGCSIDSSVRVLKELEQLLKINLFDRNLIAFWTDAKVTLIPLAELKQKFQSGILNEQSLAFNNLISTRGDLERTWLLPAGETWLKRYLSNPLAKAK